MPAMHAFDTRDDVVKRRNIRRGIRRQVVQYGVDVSLPGGVLDSIQNRHESCEDGSREAGSPRCGDLVVSAFKPIVAVGCQTLFVGEGRIIGANDVARTLNRRLKGNIGQQAIGALRYARNATLPRGPGEVSACTAAACSNSFEAEPSFQTTSGT